MALWDSPRQREAYDWFTAELANLRTAFRWAADQGELDSAVALATCAASLGVWVEQYEPMAWAEELIESARRAKHRRLPHLYVVASQCYAAGRLDDAVEYLDASRQLTESGDFDEVPYEGQYSSGIVYTHAGQSERWAQLCRSAIERGTGPLTVTHACLVMAFYFLGNGDEAMAASQGLLAAADAARSPSTACFALLAHGLAYYEADPAAAYNALRRSLAIAQESRNRQMESASASTVLLVATTYGDPIESFETLLVLIRRYYDVGNTALLRNPLAILASLLDRLGHHEQAAIISGSAASDFSRASYPQFNTAITHLRDVLGAQTYESLARTGETMTTADIVAYAYDQIDQARAQLNAASA
jgi:hypothetical protein